MGIPKFFRWIGERYPCITELVREYQIPEFDNLYLDMNGIIHMCSHPNEFDPHFRITEEKIFQDIFQYIEILFRMIKPQRLFFMAVDGVAPRAKMNQQRGRRFRSAKEAEIMEQKAQERGEALPAESRFDSNCITPGTVFMSRLHEQLKYFVTYKISTDKQWQNIKVILSGHETPGEGEHKIMEYIRYMKSQPGYDPNTRHCLYGLDADLIMLGLCSHEPHFSLLREEVKYRKTKEKRRTTPGETRFFLLHLSLMREYLELEFQELQDNESFKFNIENIIDDWVLMCFLVGNDFIPPLPDMHITSGALPTLYKAYMEIFPSLGGYINEAGTLNMPRFKKYMEKLSAFDINKFRDTYADLKYFRGKTGHAFGSQSEKGTDKEPSLDELMPLRKSELRDLVRMTNSELQIREDEDQELAISSEEDFDTDEEEIFLTHFRQHKRDYYMNKMEYAIVDREVLRSQANGYVQAIQWNLHYYYNGVCSWSWFYPHHYAPYISDICNFSDNLELHFDLGEPFLPFEQLLAVLPAGSKNLLPEPFQRLMVNEDSPILHFYPPEFRTDLNGKMQDWEAVVLIPFIDEKSLLAAMEPLEPLLTADERRRNNHGPMLIYTYTEEDQGVYEAPEYFPRVANNHAAKLELMRDELHVEQNRLVKGLCPGVRLDVYFPGFPTLKHIPHTASLKKMKVKVFDHNSQGHNMILKIADQGKPDIEDIAKDLLGQIIYVSWPHLAEAKVIAVSNRDFQCDSLCRSSKQCIVELKPNCAAIWSLQCNAIREQYLEKRGVEIGDTKILVTVLLLSGRTSVYSGGSIIMDEQWNGTPISYALQTTVRNIPVQEQTYAKYKSIEELFPYEAVCFMTGHPHYGAMGEVSEGIWEAKSGRIKVSMKVTPEPNLEDIRKQAEENITQYMSGNQAAYRLQISSHLVSRITGTLYVLLTNRNYSSDSSPKVNIGLNLKFSKRNEEIAGYSRKDGTVWLYSIKAVDLVQNYMMKFPELFVYLSRHTGDDVFYATEIFPGDYFEAIAKVNEIADWLKDQPHYNIERSLCGSELLDTDVIQALENKIDDFYSQQNNRAKNIQMQVKPHLLFRPTAHIGTIVPDVSATHKLLDRIVNVRDCFTVPLGLKGTIIGIRRTENEGERLYDVLFDKPFTGGLTFGPSSMRAYRVPRSSFLNLSHGQRYEKLKMAKKPTVSIKEPEHNINQSQCVLPRNTYPPSAFASWTTNTEQRVRPSVAAAHNTSGNSRNMSQSFNQNGNMVQPQFVGNFSAQQQSGPSGRNSRYEQNVVPTKLQFSPSQPNSTAEPVSTSSPSREFEAMWTCLQKASENVHPKIKQHSDLVPQLVPVNESEEVPDKSGTELLKKMLRIADKVTPEPLQPRQSSPSTILSAKKQTSSQMQVQHNFPLPPPLPQQPFIPQLQSIKKVSVEEIFKHAKNTETTPPMANGQGNYCMQLLRLFQSNDFGTPRYTYISNIADGTVTAEVMLPDMRSFTGKAAPSRDEASENAAFVALDYFSRYPGSIYAQNTSYSQNNTGANMGFMAVKPGTNTLPVPPQQWYSHQQQFGNYHFNRQEDWWQGADIVQQQYNQQQQPSSQDMSAVGKSQQYAGLPQNSQQFWKKSETSGNWRQQQQQHHPGWLKEQQQHQSSQVKFQVPKPSVEELQRQFVPLQAVKQQRNKAGGITQSSPQQAQEVDLTQQIEQNLKISESKDNINKENQNVQATGNIVTKKPLMVRPRKSRIAANFDIKPIIDQ